MVRLLANAVSEFSTHSFLQITVWKPNCRSWTSLDYDVPVTEKEILHATCDGSFLRTWEQSVLLSMQPGMADQGINDKVGVNIHEQQARISASKLSSSEMQKFSLALFDPDSWSNGSAVPIETSTVEMGGSGLAAGHSFLRRASRLVTSQ